MADLGCGNGVLALAVALRMPAATITGVDESYQAVASAIRNLAEAGLSGRDIGFAVADGLSDQSRESLDAVVCNPPFHMARAVGEDRRQWALGLGTAAGSLGQFAVVPLAQVLIDAFGWAMALNILAGSSLAMALLAMPLAR